MPVELASCDYALERATRDKPGEHVLDRSVIQVRLALSASLELTQTRPPSSQKSTKRCALLANARSVQASPPS